MTDTESIAYVRGATIAKCFSCGKEREVNNSILKIGKGKYCSRECFYREYRKHPFVDFDGKRYIKDHEGYYKAADNERLHRSKWMKEHGEIPKGFLIHHKDGDRGNNDLDNLELMEWGKHTTHHKKKGKTMKTMNCSFCGNEVTREETTFKRFRKPFCNRSCHMLYRNRVLQINPYKNVTAA